MISSETAAKQSWVRTADWVLDEHCHVINAHRLEAQDVRGYGVSLIAATSILANNTVVCVGAVFQELMLIVTPLRGYGRSELYVPLGSLR